MRRPLLLLLLLAALPAAAFGCQSSSDPTSSPGTTAPSTTFPSTTSGPVGRTILSKSGACGDAYFWASNPAGTVAVTVTVDVRARSASAPTSVAFTVPDPSVKIEIQRGRNLLQAFCSDVIGPDWHVDSREGAAHGTGRIVVAPALTAGRCGAEGQLHLDGLVTAGGTRFGAIDVTTRSIGCYAG